MIHPITTIRQFNFSTWWNYRTLFDATPPYVWTFQWWYAGLTIICIVAAIVVSFLKMRDGLKRRLINLFWTNGMVGLILYFARVQLIPYIGTDAVRFFQIIIFIGWSFSVFRYYQVKYPKEIIAEQANMRFNKYLPKAKKSV